MAQHPDMQSNNATELRRKQIAIPAAAGAASALSQLLIDSGVITAAELSDVIGVKLKGASAEYKVGDAADHSGLSLDTYGTSDTYEEPLLGEGLKTEFAKMSSGGAGTAEARVYLTRR